MKNVLVVSTLDTKGGEIFFIKEQIEKYGGRPIIIDAGILGEPFFPPDITREKIAESAGTTLAGVKKIKSEGEAMEIMIKGTIAQVRELHSEGQVGAILSIGGSMGTALGTEVMRSLPIGIPKIMVSTMAAIGEVGAYIGTKDICMYHSVADIAGLNRLTRTIFTNAASAAVAMAHASHNKPENKKLVCVSTLGTTEAAARKARELLENAGYETVTFHANGVGGKCLEQLLIDGMIDGGVVEFSLHEWIERVMDGIYQPPDYRYENAGRQKLPQVYVPGSVDFVSHKSGEERFQGRKAHKHNWAITLYRTTRNELLQVGREVAQKLNRSKSPVTILIPMRGFSVHDFEGGPLWDPEANMGFVEGIEDHASPRLQIKRVDAHILDDRFVQAVIEAFLENVDSTG